MTTATKPKRPKHDYTFAGEELEIDPEFGRDWRTRYAEAAMRLREAKDAVIALEDEIKLVQGGYEHVAVDGEQIVHWPWVDDARFSVTEFKKEHPALHKAFTRVKRIRRFKVVGVENVDV